MEQLLGELNALRTWSPFSYHKRQVLEKFTQLSSLFTLTDILPFAAQLATSSSHKAFLHIRVGRTSWSKSRPESLFFVVELQDKKPGNCYYTVSYISPCHHYEHLGIWPSSRVSMSARGYLVLTFVGWYGMIYMPIVAEQLFSLRKK